ncbi:putative DNA-binding transcriptional regulator AlpA [Nitrobacteraceae bacterium AZCC 2161]
MARTPHNDQRSPIAPDRLGWRLPEWMKLTNTSRQTLWRQVKRGDLRIIYVGPTPMVPRSEAIRLGLINS